MECGGWVDGINKYVDKLLLIFYDRFFVIMVMISNWEGEKTPL